MDTSGEGFVKSDPEASSSKKGAGDTDRKSKTVLPVNTGMVNKLTHPALGLVLQRHKYSTVTIVGFVSDFSDMGSRSEFRINDSCGAPVLVQQWKGGEDQAGTPVAHETQIQNDALIRVFGHPRKTAASKDPLLLASKILPVTDVNELTMHCLDIVTAHLTLKKRKDNIELSLPDVTGFPGSVVGDVGNVSFSNTTVHKGAVTGPATPQNSQPKAVPVATAKELVLKAISKDSSVQGISLIELESSLKSLNMKLIREAIDFLLNEGHIYTTTDETHFKSLEG